MENLEERTTDKTFTAVVAGATGATGRWIVCELVNNDACSKVVALTRSEIPKPTETFPDADPTKIEKKLEVKKIDFTELKSSEKLPFKVTDESTVGFCAMGSAPYSEDSDFTTPVAFAKACKFAGINSMFLVSAAGAKAGSFWGIADTLGRREDAFKDVGFERLGIYRSYFIERQEKMRWKEYISKVLPSSLVISSKDIARVMVESAIRMKKGTYSFSHSDMNSICEKLKH
jgi:uncharacterized protein YbjT (DUF2867 family)